MTSVISMPRWLRLVMAAFVAFAFLTACGSSPPEALDKDAKSVETAIKDARKANDKAKDAFPGLLKQEKYAFIAGYPAAQQHSDRFGQAKGKLDDAQRVYDREIKPITGDYEDSKKGALEAAIKKAKGLVEEAKGLTAHPAQWLNKVAAIKADPAGSVRTATTSVSNIQAVYTPLSGDVDAAKKTYERNAGQIDAKFQPLKTQHDQAFQANGLLQAESKKTPPNYALMAEHSSTVENNAVAFKKDAPEFKSRLAQLNVRQTQTLVDIRVDSEVTITRTTWDDYYDWPDEHDHEYPSVMVDLETANYFAQFKPDDVLAVDGGGGFKTDKADRKQWDKLNISPRNPKWHGDDDTAEFYGEVEDTYCHKLRVLKDGKPDASGRPAKADNYCAKYDTDGDLAQGMYWVEADELDAEAIGMDIYSKGLGDFDDQATDEATPPGMVYVGDTSTGEWQTDNNGNSFWAFYGQYMFFSQLIGGPNSYHYRSEYDDWNRNYRYGHRPYYGSFNGQPRYGMKSPLAQSRFPNSTYVRSGLFNSSVRGAGPAARAGGPGGGGK